MTGGVDRDDVRDTTGGVDRDDVRAVRRGRPSGRPDDSAAERLARERGLAVFYVPVRISPERTSGNAILSTLPLSNTRTITLPQERQPRSAAAATLDIDGRPLFVVSAHLENRLGFMRGLFGDYARRRQAEALLQALPSQGDGILGGDMNTMLGPEEPALRVFLQRFPDTPAERPQPTFRERLALDHVFFDLPDGWRASRRVIDERYGSDHHPVVGIVAIGRGGS